MNIVYTALNDYDDNNSNNDENIKKNLCVLNLFEIEARNDKETEINTCFTLAYFARTCDIHDCPGYNDFILMNQMCEKRKNSYCLCSSSTRYTHVSLIDRRVITYHVHLQGARRQPR